MLCSVCAICFSYLLGHTNLCPTNTADGKYSLTEEQYFKENVVEVIFLLLLILGKT